MACGQEYPQHTRGKVLDMTEPAFVKSLGFLSFQLIQSPALTMGLTDLQTSGLPYQDDCDHK